MSFSHINILVSDHPHFSHRETNKLLDPRQVSVTVGDNSPPRTILFIIPSTYDTSISIVLMRTFVHLIFKSVLGYVYRISKKVLLGITFPKHQVARVKKRLSPKKAHDTVPGNRETSCKERAERKEGERSKATVGQNNSRSFSATWWHQVPRKKGSRRVPGQKSSRREGRRVGRGIKLEVNSEESKTVRERRHTYTIEFEIFLITFQVFLCLHLHDIGQGRTF